LISILIVGSFFILWDSYFTSKEIWGFNSRYLLGITIFGLPLEECLFFIVVPYACLFIHEVLKAYFPNVNTHLLGKIFAFSFALSGLLLSVTYINNWYTLTACSLSSLLVIGLAFRAKVKWFGSFAFTYMVALIPFLIVNGLLTGFFTDEPVVWYNEDHIIGWRIGSIPFEDLYYNLAMLLPIVAIHEKWIQKKRS
jgi:lycopene cyclase domain-containing protein